MIRTLFGIIALALFAGCGTDSSKPALALGDVEFRGAPGSAEPNLFAARDGRVILTWHEPQGEEYALRASVREAGRWTEPVTIVDGRPFFVNWADFPSLAELDDGTWVVHWLEKVGSSSYAYHAMVSRSSDGGRTWTEPTAIHEDRSPTEHGFVSMVPRTDGSLAMVWLDGRNTGPDAGDARAMQLRSKVWGGEGDEERLIDGRVCDCCQTALVETRSGLLAAYRDRSEEEIRDIAVSRLVGGEWSEPVRIGNDQWHLRGCPVNGPSLSAMGDTVAIVWFTGSDGEPKVFQSFSEDGGRRFGEPVRVDQGNAVGRVDVEMIEGGALVVWLERVGDDAEIRARFLFLDGTVAEPYVVASTSPTRPSGFPRVTRSGDEMIFAWTEVGDQGGVRVSSAALGR
jgi:hypothetical protein